MILQIVCFALFCALVWVVTASYAMHVEHQRVEFELREQLMAWEIFRDRFEAMPEPDFSEAMLPAANRCGWRRAVKVVIDTMPAEPKS